MHPRILVIHSPHRPIIPIFLVLEYLWYDVVMFLVLIFDFDTICTKNEQPSSNDSRKINVKKKELSSIWVADTLNAPALGIMSIILCNCHITQMWISKYYHRTEYTLTMFFSLSTSAGEKCDIYSGCQWFFFFVVHSFFFHCTSIASLFLGVAFSVVQCDYHFILDDMHVYGYGVSIYCHCHTPFPCMGSKPIKSCTTLSKLNKNGLCIFIDYLQLLALFVLLHIHFGWERDDQFVLKLKIKGKKQ